MAQSPAAQTPCPSCGAVNRIAEGRDRAHAKCGRCHQPLFTGKPVEVDAAGLDRFQRLARGVPVLLDVWAPWCGPCRTMAPHFEAAAAVLTPDVILLKLNSEDHPQAANRLRVQGIPALFLFRDGAVAGRTAGALTKDQLVAWTRQTLGRATAA